MSPGPGAIERPIADLFAEAFDRGLSVEDICDHPFGLKGRTTARDFGVSPMAHPGAAGGSSRAAPAARQRTYDNLRWERYGRPARSLLTRCRRVPCRRGHRKELAPMWADAYSDSATDKWLVGVTKVG